MADPGELPLSDEEIALVFRRAAELDVERGLPASSSLDLATLEEIGREVGLSPQSIRQAVAELRSGSLREPGTALAARSVVCSRVVPLSRDEARRALDHWLDGQLFEPVRDRLDTAVYIRRRDRAAMHALRRLLRGSVHLGAVGRVRVAVSEVGPAHTSLVRVECELERGRRERVWSRSQKPLWVSGAVIAGAVAISPALAIGHVVLLGPIAGAGSVALGYRRAGLAVERDRESVELAVDGILDRLESGRPA